MEFINKVTTYIDSLEEKKFYRMVAISFSVLMLIIFIIIYKYFGTISDLKKRIRQTNELRAQTRQIISQYQQVVRQQQEVDSMLAEDPNFKILGYFTELRNKLGLAATETTSTVDRDDKYRETTVTGQFFGITMKQLVELLKLIEQNKRVYTKSLEISAAKGKKIDVTLTIATLQLKTAPTE